MAKKSTKRKKDVNKKKRSQNMRQRRTYMQCGKSKVCVEDLIQEVNSFDKSWGLKLKNPEIWADPFVFRNIFEAKTDMNIAAMICCINGVPINDYFETDQSKSQYGTICKPIGVEHPVFTDASCLDWDNKKTNYKTDSLMFRCRYTTLVLSSILGRTGEITKRETDRKYRMKHSRDEKQIILTKELLNDCMKFTKCMITPNSSYKNIILKMHEHVSYTKKKVSQRKLKYELNDKVIGARKFSQYELLAGRKFFDDDQCIDWYLQAAYMLATNDTNTDERCIPFKYIENATFKHDLIKVIEDLGANIISQCKGHKYSPMFKAFIESRPSIYSQYYKECNENCAVKMGIIALSYAKFVFNDKTCDKYFDQMLKKGI